ncbi:MAG: hypothetical protein A3B66_02345 [Alphaproteobacteria bacterium RIFCSPHIGHO2_02_FULL_46_13]|nr:MAG: hypothetical protein A3B66_02345 [Alphaproteobacteria bacterium RIFCSPHIGHO2_02_FULL_46_13]
MVGTNHGDTVTMESAVSGFGSYGWIGFVSGLGDDTITINDDYTKAAVVYTGGDDVIYGHLEQLSLAPDIELQDVSVGSITVSGYDVETGAVLYSAVLSIAGHGSIAVENFAADNGLGFQTIQIVLQSEAGYVDVSTDGTMTLSAEPLSYPVLMGGDEVHWGHSRTMVGTDADDVLSGGYRDDVLFGLAGNDTLSGNLGNDTLHGGDGDDTIYGDGGDDLIYGEAGANILYGGAGDDTFFMQFGSSETATGGQGNDIYKISNYTNNVVINDHVGANIITFDNVIASQLTYKIEDNDLSLYKSNQKLASITGYKDHFSFVFQDGETLTSQEFIETSSVYIPPVFIPVVTYQGYGLTAYAKTDDKTYEYWLSPGNDTFWGSSVKDIVRGFEGNDLFFGFAGDDDIDGGTGRDEISYYYSGSRINADLDSHIILDGNGGVDTVTSIEIVYGSFYNDTINGDENANFLYGNPGDDIINGRDGNDELYGGFGNDVLNGGAGDDLIFGHAGNDLIDGGDGQDGVSYYYSSSAITADLAAHTVMDGENGMDTISNVEIIYGSAFNDLVKGDENADTIYGNAGSDVLIGKAGNDTIYGGDGDDTIDCGVGDDALFGNAGNDTYIYLSGADSITDTSGTMDKVVFDSSLSTNDVRITGNVLSFINSTNSITFDDITQIEAFSFSGQSEMTLAQLQAYISAHSGGSNFVATAPVENFVGAGPSDTVDYNASTAAVSIDLLNNAASGGYAQGDTLTSIENITGSNIISQRDTIYGNAANNKIYGLAGNDVLEGGAGADLIDGGDGWDNVRYTRSTSGVYINLGTNINTGGDAEGDTLFNIEAVVGSNYNDTLIGGNGSDYLAGGNGNDILIGGKAVDSLNGGNGADTFRFRAVDLDGTADGISDFNISQGDKIDLKDLFFGYNPSTSSITDYVEFSTSGANTIVKIDRDGAGTAYGWQILAQLDNVTGLTDEQALFNSGNLIMPDAVTTSPSLTINGTSGNDTLMGTTADETLNGYDGNDVLVGGAGADILNGGNGNDTADYSGSLLKVTIDLQNGTASDGDAQGDTLISIENIIGSNQTSQRDTIYGDAQNNHIYGLAGNDILEGGAGADLIDGGDGWDTVRYTRSTSGVNINLETNINTGGDAEGDTLFNIEAVTGSGHNDILIGGLGDDYLAGGAGNDILIGGKGVDALNGGSGADTFMFLAKDLDGRMDGIFDFNVSQGDKIDLKDLLFGYDPVSSAITGFIEFTTSGANTIIKVDRDGAGSSYGWQSIVQLDNVTGLTDEAALKANGNLIVA